MGSPRHAYSFVIALALALGACSGPAPPPAPATTAAAGKPDPWPQYAARFIEDYFRAEPFFAVQAGRHEFDGQMPDWSADALAAEAARLKKMRAEAEGFDAATLTAEERFEREYLYTVIDSELFWRERARAPFTNPAWYLDRLDPDVYLNRAYAPLAKRLAGYIGYARAIPQDRRRDPREPAHADAATFVSAASTASAASPTSTARTSPRCSPPCRTRRRRRTSPPPTRPPRKAMDELRNVAARRAQAPEQRLRPRRAAVHRDAQDHRARRRAGRAAARDRSRGPRAQYPGAEGGVRAVPAARDARCRA